MALSFSLCMIVKDEECFIQRSILSAKPYVDDIVVADTGSMDNTKHIATANGARVFDFTWCDDFSAARNFAAAQAAHDWILMLDADEEIVSFDRKGIAQVMTHPAMRGSVMIHDVMKDHYFQITRLYNKGYCQYEGTIHEQIIPIHEQIMPIDSNNSNSPIHSNNPNTPVHSNHPNSPNLSNSERRVIKIPVQLKHYGYAADVVLAKNKLARNERLLLKALEEKPENAYLLYQLGRCYFAAADGVGQACEYFGRALAKGPDPRLHYVYLLVECYGYALINTQQYKKALEHVQRYADVYRNNPDFRFLTAHAQMQNAMFIDAVASFESCIGDAAANNPAVTTCLSYYNIGVILECVGMTEDARQMYTQCGAYEPALARLRTL